MLSIPKTELDLPDAYKKSFYNTETENVAPKKPRPQIGITVKIIKLKNDLVSQISVKSLMELLRMSLSTKKSNLLIPL